LFTICIEHVHKKIDVLLVSN